MQIKKEKQKARIVKVLHNHYECVTVGLITHMRHCSTKGLNTDVVSHIEGLKTRQKVGTTELDIHAISR